MIAATAIAVLFAVAAGGIGLGAAVAARHRAQAAADLAALAAAALLPEGAVTACGRAAALAERLMVRQTSCRIDGLDVVVTVAAPVGVAAGVLGPARAAARAGPSG